MRMMPTFVCATYIFFVFPIHAASWWDGISEWLGHEVPVCERTSMQCAWVQEHASPMRLRADETALRVTFDSKDLAAMLTGNRSEQLYAQSYLQEAIDKGTLTPVTRLMVAQHAKQLQIPRDEQMYMLSELLQNSDHTIRLAALRVAEKEMSELDLESSCLWIGGITVSGLALGTYGSLAGALCALGVVSAAVSTSDPAYPMMKARIAAVKTTLAKQKSE